MPTSNENDAPLTSYPVTRDLDDLTTTVVLNKFSSLHFVPAFIPPPGDALSWPSLPAAVKSE